MYGFCRSKSEKMTTQIPYSLGNTVYTQSSGGGSAIFTWPRTMSFVDCAHPVLRWWECRFHLAQYHVLCGSYYHDPAQPLSLDLPPICDID